MTWKFRFLELCHHHHGNAASLQQNKHSSRLLWMWRVAWRVVVLVAILAVCVDTVVGSDDNKGLEPFRGLACRDDSKCHRITDCSDKDAARRAGNTCNGWPYYNGGYPISEVKWDEEEERYECEVVAQNGLYCESWTADEFSSGEQERGSCGCVAESDNGKFCAEWDCIQTETDACPPGNYASGTRCCYVDEDGNRRCTQREIEVERTTCVVGETADGVLPDATIILSWSCVETDNNGLGAAEYEEYVCVQREDNYCAAYQGHIWSKEEFEVSGCNVRTSRMGTNGTSEYPALWRCFEKGVSYVLPNVWFVFLMWLVGGIGLSGVFYALYTYYASLFFFVGLFWFLGFSFIAVWQGGFYVLFIGGVAVLCVWFALDWKSFTSGSSDGFGSICFRPAVSCCMCCFVSIERATRPKHKNVRHLSSKKRVPAYSSSYASYDYEFAEESSHSGRPLKR